MTDYRARMAKAAYEKRFPYGMMMKPLRTSNTVLTLSKGFAHAHGDAIVWDALQLAEIAKTGPDVPPLTEDQLRDANEILNRSRYSLLLVVMPVIHNEGDDLSPVERKLLTSLIGKVGGLDGQENSPLVNAFHLALDQAKFSGAVGVITKFQGPGFHQIYNQVLDGHLL